MKNFFTQIPIVAPTPTPFKDDEVDYQKLSSNIEKWLTTSISGFVLGSHGGEEFHLSDQEKFQILATVVQVNDGHLELVVALEHRQVDVLLAPWHH